MAWHIWLLRWPRLRSRRPQETVKIGVVTDHTGNAAEFARIEEQGLELALKEVNASGGILGKKVELLYEDDEDKPALSATKVRKLASDGVPIIIQLSSSTSTQQAESASLETKTPHLGANQSADSLTTKLDNPYFFLAGMPASIQFKTLLAFTKMRYKTAAIFADTSAIAHVYRQDLQGRAGACRHQARRRGDHRGRRDRCRAAGAAHPQRQSRSGARCREHDLGIGDLLPLLSPARRCKIPIIASYNKSIPRYLQLVPGMLDGVAFLDCFDQDKPETKAYIEKFEANDHEEPYSLSAYGYNAMMLVKDAITRAGSLDREKIRDGACQHARLQIGDRRQRHDLRLFGRPSRRLSRQRRGHSADREQPPRKSDFLRLLRAGAR